MKQLTLLFLLVSAIAFGQTNATFNNLDVRGTSKLRGIPYTFGAVATSPLNPTLHEVAMVNNSTFALCRIDFEEFADSIANYLNPIIGTHWYTVPPDTIKTIYNVVVDSSFVMKYNGWYSGYMEAGNTESIIISKIDGSDGIANITFNDNGNYMWYVQTINAGGTASGVVGIDTNGTVRAYMGAEIAGQTSSMQVYPTYTELKSDSILIDGNVEIEGDLTYEYIHLVAYTSGGSYTPNTVSNVEFKLTPTFTTAENDGFTFAGDTVTIITPGDYMVQFSTVFQGANGDDWLFKCRKNGTAITSGNLALTTTGAGNYCSGSWVWYLPGLAAGDDISFSVTNEGANNDPTFRSVKIYVDKKPE